MKGFLAALLLSAPLFANAYAIAPDVIDFNPNPVIHYLQTYSYQHDLTDNAGYNPADQITDFTLTLDFINTQTRDFLFGDVAVISLDTEYAGSAGFQKNYISGTWSSSYANGALLFNNGILDVAVTSFWGDFELDKSTVTANAKSTNVPEPSSLALLAAGMIGIVIIRRKATRAN